jgi:hypothetical protein
MSSEVPELYPDLFQEISPERLAAIQDDMAYNDTRFSRNYRVGGYEPGYTIMDFMVNGSYEIGDTKMKIHDAVWGEELIGEGEYDQMLIELARTPLFRRMQAIEQLTLGPEYATMPNSMYFSRWEHIWGSLVFVRKMTEGDERFTERDRMVLQLRTLLSDVGHTAFSHLGDWLFQGKQGGEDLHDEELKQLLHVTGIEDILQKYGFTIDETVFPEVEDWVEASSPRLCVDRVDYGLREILRWMPGILHMYQRPALANPKELFAITEDKHLVITDLEFARQFAAGYAMLPTEHWGHPVHRMMLNLLETSVKSVILSDMDASTHPRDLMFGVDADFSGYFKTWHSLQFDKLLSDIALSQRRIFVSARESELKLQFSHFVDGGPFPEYPDPLRSYSWRSEMFGGSYPAQTEFTPVELATGGLRALKASLQIPLPSLKARQTDPPVMLDGVVRPLSELDASYAPYLREQSRFMAQHYIGKVFMRGSVASLIKKQAAEIEQGWQQALRRPIDLAKRERIIREGWMMAAGSRLDRIVEVDDEDIARRPDGLNYRI